MTQRCCEVTDRHLPRVVMDNFLRRVIVPPRKKLSKFILTNRVSVDIGCGPGYFTIPMGELAGRNGKVYAVDSDPKSIKALQAKSIASGLQGVIEAHTGSAANMGFIESRSVDFVFANGVLCCMTDHGRAVEEIKRILKPEGLAYLSVTKVFRKSDPRSVRKEEWTRLLDGFGVGERGEGLVSRWATVSLLGS